MLKRSVPILDLSYLFPSDKFDDYYTIDECLNFGGRKIWLEL